MCLLHLLNQIRNSLHKHTVFTDITNLLCCRSRVSECGMNVVGCVGIVWALGLLIWLIRSIWVWWSLLKISQTWLYLSSSKVGVQSAEWKYIERLKLAISGWLGERIIKVSHAHFALQHSTFLRAQAVSSVWLTYSLNMGVAQPQRRKTKNNYS